METSHHNPLLTGIHKVISFIREEPLVWILIQRLPISLCQGCGGFVVRAHER